MKKVFNYLGYHGKQFINCLKFIKYVKYLSKEKEDTLKNKNYVLLTIRQFPLIMIQEIFIGALLARKGASVTMILDDGYLRHWDTFMVTQRLNIRNLNPLMSHGIRYYERKAKAWLLRKAAMFADIRLVFIEKVENPELDTICKKVIDDSKNDIVNAIYESSVRYFQTEYFNSEKNFEIYSEYCRSNIESIIKTFIRINSQCRIDCIISSHGFLSCWKPSVIMSKYFNCDLRIYGQNGHSDGKVLVMKRAHNFFGSTELPSDLAEVEERQDHIEKRIRKSLTLDSSIYYSGKMANLNYKKSGFTVGLFPGIIWDMNTPERNVIFSGVSDWIVSMIKMSRKMGFRLVIRFHPAESTMFDGFGSLKSNLVNRYGPDIFENVQVIESSLRVDSHEFASQNIDVALVYDGILGIELPSIGVNTILCANGRFNHKQINYTAKSIEDLERLLILLANNKNYVLSKNARQYANKFLNAYIEDFSFDMPVFSNHTLLEIDLGKKNSERLQSKFILDNFIKPFVI